MSEIHHPRWSRRRVLSATSAGVLLLALAPVTMASVDGPTEPRDTDFVCQEPYEDEFEDVADDNTHYENILCAAEHEVARGHTDGTYRPGNSVRRDQMASFIVRLIETAGNEELEEGDEDFDDVPEDNEHYENINKLAAIEVVEGFEDGTYRPRESVTRDQMASYIGRAISYLDNDDARDGSEPPAATDDHFEDVGTTSPHHGAISALAEQRIVVGDGEGTYNPRRDVRRDQMASFLMRGYDYAAEAGLVDPLGPSVMGAGTLSSDRIQVGFDDGVEVLEVTGFRVYGDEACAEQVAQGSAAQGGGPFVDVELTDDLTAGEDHWLALEGRSVENGDGYPNVPSDCIELLGGPLGGDDGDNGDNGDNGENGENGENGDEASPAEQFCDEVIANLGEDQAEQCHEMAEEYFGDEENGDNGDNGEEPSPGEQFCDEVVEEFGEEFAEECHEFVEDDGDENGDNDDA